MEREMIEKPEEKEFFSVATMIEKEKEKRWRISFFSLSVRCFLGDLWRLIRSLENVVCIFINFGDDTRKKFAALWRRENFLYKSCRKEVVTYEFQREFLINLEIPNEIFN